MYEVNIGKIHYEMMRQCYNEKAITYKAYGAKGIKVCEEWHDREVFRQWCRSHGWVKGLRLLRYDNTADFTPDNCYIGKSKYKKIHGNAQFIKQRAKENKAKKNALGLKRLSDSPLYTTYKNMLSRCNNPKDNGYKYYGKRGIKVCEEWSSKDGIYNFIRWSNENGWKKGLTLDRIDSDGNYEPNNCRWTDWVTQGNNKRNVVKYEYKGEMLSISQIARTENIPQGLFRSQIRDYGKTIVEAIEYCKAKTSA